MKGSGLTLKSCPESPNCVLSTATEKQHAIEPFTLKGDAASSLKALKEIVSSSRGAQVVKEEPGYFHAEFKSAWFGFVDDVEFLADEQNQLIHVRSASRVGYSDLGANRKRVEMLRRQYLEKS